MKPASVLLIALIALCSLAGCGGKEARRQEVPTPPAVLNLPASPAPQKPELPQIDGALPLDHPHNVDVLLERDDIMRALIKALYAALGIPDDNGKGEIK
ncbi:MAG: hypothetical protein DELT_02536 [Desulfovibrio sp.]